MDITQLKYFLLGRKNYQRRPLGVTVFAFLILLLPFYYYLKSIEFNWNMFANWRFAAGHYEIQYIVISVCAVICFLGLFFVLRVGFFLFFLLSLSFIFFNLYQFFTSADIFNVESVLLAFFGVSAFIYFTSRENSAPYIYRRNKGWRSEVRRNLNHTVTVNGMKRSIGNINSRGMLVKWKNPEFSVDEDVTCSMTINGERFHIDGVVVRTTENSAAFAFRNMDVKTRKDLYYALKFLEEEKARKE